MVGPKPQSKRPTQVAARSCGDCNACGQKDHIETRGQLDPRGSALACLWRADHAGWFSDQHRPDRLGVVLQSEIDAKGGLQIIAYELWPVAACGAEAERVVAHLRQLTQIRTVAGRNESSRDGSSRGCDALNPDTRLKRIAPSTTVIEHEALVGFERIYRQPRTRLQRAVLAAQ